jgi:hypothetical protein
MWRHTENHDHATTTVVGYLGEIRTLTDASSQPRERPVRLPPLDQLVSSVVPLSSRLPSGPSRVRTKGVAH